MQNQKRWSVGVLVVGQDVCSRKEAKLPKLRQIKDMKRAAFLHHLKKQPEFVEEPLKRRKGVLWCLFLEGEVWHPKGTFHSF